LNLESTKIGPPTDYLFLTFVKPFPPIKYNNTTRHEIEKIIKSLKFSNSCRYNEISVKILKLSCSYKSSSLTKLCNLALSTGMFPDYLKYSEIKPFFKSGKKIKWTVIGQYQYYLRSLKSSKNSYFIDLFNTLMTIKS
jgi:hypothetical protein